MDHIEKTYLPETRVDLMVDLETLGTTPGSTIFQIAAVEFDLLTGDIHDTLDLVADISVDEIDVEGGTLLFWMDGNAERFRELLLRGKADGMSPTCALIQFDAWVRKRIDASGRENVFLWGNGIANDNLWLREAYRKAGLSWPIHFRNDRDVRTVRELSYLRNRFRRDYAGEARTNDRPHDALSDAIFQARNVADEYAHLTGFFAGKES